MAGLLLLYANAALESPIFATKNWFFVISTTLAVQPVFAETLAEFELLYPERPLNYLSLLYPS